MQRVQKIRTIYGTIEAIEDRLGPTGENIVKLILVAAGYRESCFAYGTKANTLRRISLQLEKIKKNKKCANISELGVVIEVTGIIRNELKSNMDMLVTCINGIHHPY